MTLPRDFWLLWFAQTLNRVGLLAPAFLVLYLEGGGIRDPHITPAVVGLFAIGVVAAGLLGGVLADMIGARRTILLAQPVAVTTALLFTFASQPYLIEALSLVTGLLSAIDRPAGAGLIARLVPQALFARAYSIYHLGYNVGLSVGPILSGLLLTVYPPGLFLLWAACALTYGLLISMLRVSEPRWSKQADGPTTLGRLTHGIVEPLRSPAVCAFLGGTFLLACVYLQVNSALPLDMRNEGLLPAKIGMVIAANALLTVALLPLVPRLVRGRRDETPLVWAAALFAVGFGLNALAHNLVQFAVALVVWTCGEVLFAPMSAAFLAKRAPADRVSTYQGAYFLSWNSAFIIAGPAGLAVANAYNFGTLWIGCLILGLSGAAVFALLPRFAGFQLAAEPSLEPKKVNVVGVAAEEPDG